MTEPLSEHYAVIEAGTIVKVVVCDDPAYAEAKGWLSLAGLDPTPWIGWTYEGDIWTAPPAEP
jgi:hypothetical protein